MAVHRLARLAFVVLASYAGLPLAGCGGGETSVSSPVAAAPPAPPPTAPAPPPPPPPPPQSSGPTWTANVFQPASDFVDRCAVVRTGVDLEGRPFTDRPGSTLLEKFWLRSWTEETYLFNTEVVDRNPADFSTREAYFDVLKTTATTPSGRPKDEFHFVIPTEEFLRERNAVASSGYGAEIVVFQGTPPRDVRVLFTEPSSPASAVQGGRPSLRRGSRFLRADGVDVVNGAQSQAEVDILVNALFPSRSGERHTFTVQDPDGTTRDIALNSADVAPLAVNRFSVLTTPNGRYGYALINTFNTFASEEQIFTALESLNRQGVNDLVLDLRYNGGGLLAVASQLAYMVAGPTRTAGRAFDRLRFNASAGNRNPVTGEINEPTPFFSTGLGFSLSEGRALPAFNLSRVFVLSTEETCSASESIINGLRGIGLEVVLIGSRTCGKPFGFYPTDNCGNTYFTIQFQGANDLGFGDYADGFVPANSSEPFGVRAPGCVAPDDLSFELGDPREGMLAAALSYGANRVCPGQPVAVAQTQSTPAGRSVLTKPKGSLVQELMRTNRSMEMP